MYWEGSYCTSRCPNTAPVPDESNICRSCAEVDPSKPFWNDFECVPCSEGEFFDGEKCVGERPSDKPFVDEHNICWACADVDVNKPRWYEGKCQACPEGEYFSNSVCTTECTGGLLKPLYGQVCVQKCGQFQVQEGDKCVCASGLLPSGSKCVLPENKKWADFLSICAASGMVVSLDGESCIPQCGDNEKVVNSRCTCKESVVKDETGTKCVARRTCTLIKLGSIDEEICLTS